MTRLDDCCWITIDTSRVALALARARIMGARYPFYLLADSRDGQIKEAEVARTSPSSQPVQGNIRHGFVYERVPHITLGSIANNAEIDVIWEKWQAKLAPLAERMKDECRRMKEQKGAKFHTSSFILRTSFAEWEIPRESGEEWSEELKRLHAEWSKAKIARQQAIDKSIAAKAEFEYLYDKPYDDKKKVRVAGPFTVESLSPHRVLGVDEDDELIDTLKEDSPEYGARQSFPQMILENLKTAGVQQAHKEDRITFTALTLWPGEGRVCAEGRYVAKDEGRSMKDETGKEAAKADSDLHNSSFIPHTSEKRAGIFIGPEFGTVQRADLVEAARECGDAGFDVLIACWFIDTDYNEESFFVRHAYFLGANDPYSALKTTLKAEINAEAWATLNSDTSRPFEKPKQGRIAVKVINHLGDEVMKVFKV